MPRLSLSRRLFFPFLTIILLLGGQRWATARAQSLRFVPTIYNVAPLTNLTNGPTGVAVDVAGNLYVADTSHGYIRKVDPTQTATIVAGQGVNTYGGDNGLAINSYLNYPTALAVDSFGNLYIADGYNYRVRRIDKAGIITTFAGGNGNGSSGEGVAATSAQIVATAIACDSIGNVYLLDSNSLTVRKVNTAGVISTFAGGTTPPSGNGDGGPALGAKFVTPTSLAMDASGNLYIGDSGSYSVRRIDTSGNISTFAGSTYGNSGNGGAATSAQFQSVAGVATDIAGSVYITDSSARLVRVVKPGGVISALAGFGQSSTVFDGRAAEAARIAGPGGIAADANGNVFFSTTSTNGIYVVAQHPERFPQTKVGATSQTQRLLLENTGATDIKLSSFTLSSDFALATTLLADATLCGQTATVYAEANNNFCTFDLVFTPTAEGIRSFPFTINSNDVPATLTQTLTSTGLGSALAMTSGQMFIVAGKHNGPVANRGENGPATQATLNDVLGLAVDSSGNMFFSEYPYCQVRRVDGKTGIITTIAGTHPLDCDSFQSNGDGGQATQAIIREPGPIALDANNNIYITAIPDSRIRWIDASGVIHTFAGTGVSSGNIFACGYSGDGGQAAQAKLCSPWGISFDTHGNLFVADTGNNVIRKIATDGTISTVAGKNSLGAGFSGDGGLATLAQLNAPRYVVLNSAGDMFISDSTNQVIRKVTASTGIISTIAGSHGTTGYRNDGSSAAGSLFNSPQGIALDAAGNLFVVDDDNMVVRKIDPAGIITTIAGNHLSYGGYNGDGPATSTYLAFPQDVFVSASGYLYINDQSNGVIRQVSPNGTLTFAQQSVGSTSDAQAVTLTNVGNMPMHFDSQFPTGLTGDFTLASGGTCDFTQALAVGANCKVNIAFAPTVAGGRSGIFAFYDDGVAAPQFVSLFGTAVQLPAQSITFTAPATPITYGATAISLTATASSGLPVSYTVTGPASLNGSTLSFTGIGTVTVTAMQSGDATHAAAAPVVRTVEVTRAVLTVSVTSAPTRIYGTSNPAFGYMIAGYVNGDSPAAAASGTPVVSTVAAPKSPIGQYPITVTQGSLVSSNYTFNFVGSLLTITGGASQLIYFPTIGDYTHVTSVQLVAFASSGLPVTFAVASGPATMNGTILNIMAAGPIQVTASQPGDSNFTAAVSVTRTFTAH